MGGALAIALARNGFTVENLIVRNLEKAEKIAALILPAPKILHFDEIADLSSDAIIIATQDSEIERAAEHLAGKLSGKPFVFHTSGSLSSGVLDKPKETGCKTGSLHPLVSISDAIRGADSFKKVFFCLEGDAEAVALAEKIVERLGGKSFSIDAKYKTLYHASAVTACGHLVALFDVATEMLQKCGLSEPQAREILLPLVKSTAENLERQTAARALTGTFARADDETLRRQIDALADNVSPEALEVFLHLGARSLDLAESQGANREKLAEMQKLIALAKKKSRC